MARKRKAARRRNPVGTLIVNPRHRKARRNRKASSRRRRNPLKVRLNGKRRRSSKRSRRGSRRRNPLTVRSNGKRRGSRRRRNPLTVRSNGRRRNRNGKRRGSKRRRNLKIGGSGYLLNGRRRRNKGRRSHSKRRRNGKGRRRGGVRVAYRSNKGRKAVRRRRNRGGGGLGGGLIGKFAGMFKRIPVIGGFLATMAGFLPFALGGALGVEPTMQVARFLAPYLPEIPASIYYTGMSLVVAALVMKFAPISEQNRKLLATAVAAAGGGVAFYKIRTGQDSDVQSETGMLEMAGVSSLGGLLGDGFQTSVVPYGNPAYAGQYGSTVYGY